MKIFGGGGQILDAYIYTIVFIWQVPASEWRTVSLVIDNGHIRVTSDSQTEQKNTFGKKKKFHHQLINTIFF